MEKLKLNEVKYSYKNRYQNVDAVKAVSYTFEKGKFYAIVGRSGCGKTTLLSMLAGLDLPTGGEVIFEGKSVAKIDRDEYRLMHVAVIYQSFNLFPLLNVLENVMFPLELQKLGKAEAKELAKKKLANVGLDEKYYKRYPSMLSGGEQQRVAIARALAANAEVILADEPTGNLDTENGQNIISILKRLAHEDNCCVIVVTHDLSTADEADEVLKMRDGMLEDEAVNE